MFCGARLTALDRKIRELTSNKPPPTLLAPCLWSLNDRQRRIPHVLFDSFLTPRSVDQLYAVRFLGRQLQVGIPDFAVKSDRLFINSRLHVLRFPVAPVIPLQTELGFDVDHDGQV